MTFLATSPCLKRIRVGMLSTSYLAAVCGFSSVLSLTIRRSWRSEAISSSTGATTRQGPHHGAQKSTSTGSLDSRTSAWKLLSVTSAIWPATSPSTFAFIASENIARVGRFGPGGHASARAYPPGADAQRRAVRPLRRARRPVRARRGDRAPGSGLPQRGAGDPQRDAVGGRARARRPRPRAAGDRQDDRREDRRPAQPRLPAPGRAAQGEVPGRPRRDHTYARVRPEARAQALRGARDPLT